MTSGADPRLGDLLTLETPSFHHLSATLPRVGGEIFWELVSWFSGGHGIRSCPGDVQVVFLAGVTLLRAPWSFKWG